MTLVVDRDADGNMVLVVHESTRNNPRIQHDMKLWRRIREYDEKEAEMSLTPVSKKQKQLIKKQFQFWEVVVPNPF